MEKAKPLSGKDCCSNGVQSKYEDRTYQNICPLKAMLSRQYMTYTCTFRISFLKKLNKNTPNLAYQIIPLGVLSQDHRVPISQLDKKISLDKDIGTQNGNIKTNTFLWLVIFFVI